MGLGDRLKEAAEGTWDIFTAPVGLVVDSARAITSDEYDPGAFGVFMGATSQAVEGLSQVGEATGLADVGRDLGAGPLGPALRFVLDEGERLYSTEFQQQTGMAPFGFRQLGFEPGEFSIQRGLGTATGAIGAGVGALHGGDITDLFNLNRQWQRSSTRTPGQAFVEQAFVPDFYRRSVTEQNEIRESSWYNLMSGSIDAVGRWITDPGVIAGKSFKFARNKYFTFKPDADMLSGLKRPKGHSAALRKLGYGIGDEIEPHNGMRRFKLRKGNKSEVYTVTKASALAQLEAEDGLRLADGVDEAVDSTRGLYSEDDLNQVRQFAIDNGVPEDQIDDFMEVVVRSTASESVSGDIASKGILGDRATQSLTARRYAGTQERPMHLINDLDEAKRYASALYQADPTDMPVILRLDADGLPVIYEELDIPAIPNTKDFDPSDAAFATLAGDAGDHVTSVERLSPEDLDPALHLDGNPPEWTTPSGRMNPRLYNPDGSPIEPDTVMNFETLRDDLTTASGLYQDSPVEAEKFLTTRQAERNRSLLGRGNTLAENAANHRIVQAHLNWIDNNGRGRTMNEIRDVLFPNTPYGGVIANWLSSVDTYAERRTILLASMGYKLPEFDGLEPMLRARINILLKDAENVAEGRPPNQVTEAMMGIDNELTNMDPSTMHDFILEQVEGLENQTAYTRFLDKVSDMAPVRQLRIPHHRMAANLLRRTAWWQESPLARPIRNVIEHRPHQYVHLDDPNSDTQIVRQLQEAQPLGFTGDDIDRYREAYTSATTVQGRELVLQELNDAIIEKAANKAGMSSEQFEDLVNESHAGVTRAREHLQSRRYASSGRDLVDIYDEGLDEIVVMPLPILSTQQANWVPLVDARQLTKMSKRVGRISQRVGRVPEAIMDQFYQLWKPSVLLRGGWMLRVVSDEQLRILAHTGSLLTHLSAIARGETPKFSSMFDSNLNLGQRAAAGFATATGTQPITATGVRLAKGVSSVAEKLKLVDEDVLKWMDDVGLEELVSSRASFGGPTEQALHNLQALIGRDEITVLDHLISKGTGQWMSIGPEDRNFAGAWTRVLTDQFGRDPLGRKMIQSVIERRLFDLELLDEKNMKGLIDDGVKFLKSTSEGREMADALPWKSRNAQGWVEDVVEELFDYTGGFDEDLLRGALDNKVSREMLERIDEAWRPQTVHAEIVDQTLGRSVVSQYIQDVVSTSYDLLGRLPTDTLSRQPFFKQLYAGEMSRLEKIRRAQGLDLDEDAIARMSQSARQYAINEVREYLYDLAEVSRFGYMIRHIAPFYPAWQEVLTVWGKLAASDPSVLARARLLWEAPNKAGIVHTDDEGEEWIQVRLGEEAADTLELSGWQRYLATGGMRFGKSSFNLVLNNPLPGVGPLIQLPVNEVVKDRPELEDSLQWLLPFGVAADSEQILFSPLVRQLKSEIQGKSGDKSYLRAYVDALTWMDVEYRAGRRSTPPTPEEAKDIADKLHTFRLVTRLSSPAQPIFDSPLEPYIDIYRDMIDNLGYEKANEAFLNEYGQEFFAVTISRTVSKTGIPPTVEAEKARREFEELIRSHPEYGRLIVGDEALGEFSTAAYAAQLERPLDPDNPFSEVERQYREFEVDPRTGGIIEVDRRIGWQEYIQALDTIDLERRRLGLPNLQVKEAQHLADAKRAVVQFLREKYPSWYEDFSTQDRLKWDKRLDAFREITNNEVLNDRADIQGLETYLELRSAVLQELNRRKQLGGAATLDATANQDLFFAWESMVFQLLEDNIAFGPLYYRYLEDDPVRLK